MQPSVVLDWYLGYMHRWLGDLGVPMWDDIMLTEDAGRSTEGRYDLGQLHTVDEYRARFEELATRGWPWININAVGLLNGTLILSLELPGYEPTGVGPTSVNPSGPAMDLVDRGYSLDGLVDDVTGSG